MRKLRNLWIKQKKLHQTADFEMYLYLFYGSKKVVFVFFWNQNRQNLEKIKLKEKRSMRQLIQTS